MTGMQALVRLPIQQRLRDAAAGLNTGGYISGYRGSPLGRYDIELWRAGPQLKSHNIVFRPGLNEDLAATAIWGAQHVTSFPGATVEGVFGIWYGKGPGVDRSGDALRHANFTGVSPKGGVIALAGDDHGAKSSTAVNFSDTSFIAVGMPVLYPSNTQELIDFGLHGIAMSRFSGCWVGMKVVTDVAEGGGTVHVGLDSPAIVIPELPAVRLAASARGRSTCRSPRRNGSTTTSFPPRSPMRARTGSTGSSQARRRRARRRRRRRQGLAGPAAGAWPARPGRAPASRRIAAAEDRHGLAARSGDRARLRARARSHRGHRREAPAARGSDPLDPLWRGNAPRIVGKYFGGAAFDPAHGASAIPNFGEITPELVAAGAVQALREHDPDCALDRSRARRPGAQQPSRARAQSRAFAPAARTTVRPECPKAAARSPASVVTPWRSREPAADDDRLAYGRRGRDVARPAAFHPPAARVRQSGRRHLRPFRLACDPTGDRRRRADHLQDSLQRLRLDDRRPADRGRHDADRRFWPSSPPRA